MQIDESNTTLSLEESATANLDETSEGVMQRQTGKCKLVHIFPLERAYLFPLQRVHHFN